MYGAISYTFAYYGEMITYLGMTMPMAVFALISWMRNPYNGNKAEVKVNAISRKETVWMCVGAAAVTAVFYFILTYFHTANIVPSTISVTTSFLAVYLTFRRSPYFALAYAANDIVLIVLWTLASAYDIPLHFGGGLLCGLFCKRPLRLYQLAENEAPPGEGILKRISNEKTAWSFDYAAFYLRYRTILCRHIPVLPQWGQVRRRLVRV